MSSSPACNNSGAGSPQFCSDPPTPATELEDIIEHDLHESLPSEDEYILVIGGLGFIGSHTSLELLKAGYNIIIVDNLSNSFRDVFDRVLLAAKLYCTRAGTQCPKAELCCADYRDLDAMSTLLTKHTTDTNPRRSTISGVIHFAAYKEVADSIKHPLKYYRNNVQGLIDLVALLDEHNIKSFIFSSSASVYGTLSGSSPRLREEDCVHEQETYFDADAGIHLSAQQGSTGITNPYGRSKFFAEAILADVCKADPAWTVLALRYFNPIGCDPSGLLGEDPRESASNLFPAAVKVLTGRVPELSIYGTDWDTPDGTAVRDFIHVSDLAKGHGAALAAAQAGRIRATFRTFNLGTGSGHSVDEVIRTLEEVTRRRIPRRAVERRDGDVGSCVAIPDRAGIELGWKTEKSLRDACVDLWNYLSIERRL
ncbi:NAD-dependent epimerase/dehydratase family protein [Aspergillus lucknowensis]|uniref:NAD-dependent epimerase/dehydratase domain-containing protein n=1 Tax=Aspergillus lucknowensis TaxID=176173 RepID=A0ABR4LZ21_9EURO